MVEIFQPGGSGSGSPLTVKDGSTTVNNVTTIDFTGAVVTNGGGGVADVAVSGSGGGTVTTVSVVSANGFAGSVANATTTPAITLTTTITGILKGNGTAISAATAGTDYVTATSTNTFTNKTYDTAGSGNSFAINGTAITAVTGTGAVVLATSPTLVTPALGVATATTINKVAFTTPATGSTLTIADGKTLTQSNTLTYTGTDGSSVAFGTGGTVLYTASTIPLTVGTTTIASGTTTRILYDNAGVLGEYTLTGSGTVVAMQTAPTFVTSITTPSVLASSNGSGSIGASGTAFSNLFLASTGTINFAAGNVVLTHATGILTQTAGELRITSANVGTNADSVSTLSSTSTLTNKTLTSPVITTGSYSGTQLLQENASVGLDPVLSADGKWTGTSITGTGGATISFGQLVYFASSAKWLLADADSASTSGSVMIGMAVTSSTDGNPITVLLMGNVRADALFATFTVGVPLYVSPTAGDITATQPSSTDQVIRVIGFALTADSIVFNPSGDYITHT